MDCPTDWVVTTAFYSAIHFIDHKLFRLKLEDGTFYENITDALKKQRTAKNRHDLRSNLVAKHLPEHTPAYDYLLTECHHARYVNYMVSSFISQRAIRELDSIIKGCDIDKK